MDKIIHDRRKRNEERELTMEMTRLTLCMIHNMSGKVAKSDSVPSDFIKLSYDTEQVVAKDTRTPEEVRAKFPEKLPQIKQ